MASELQMLTASLYRIAQQHRASRDITRPALQRALREVLASMTVYRTYVREDSWDVSEADYRTVTTAVRMAKRRNRTLPVSVFDFIASVLLLEHPPTISDEQAAERRKFALKFQQVSGPVAAKGVEDTAFYRYYPLASLNEVGGELDAKPLSVDEFHRLMRRRVEEWPHSLNATSTHDSKRGEDFRARLHVLSEAPAEWADVFKKWQRMNRPLIREIDGDPAPDANEEYLIYQTLVGTWPLNSQAAEERDQYRDRILQYMEKALNEAKVHTSWMNPSESYQAAVREFICDLLGEKGQGFGADVTRFVDQIADSGFVNSLAQLVLKSTVPGVPDFYRGTELWDFNLVDPDNRRPVDYDARRQRLDELCGDAEKNLLSAARSIAARWPDPDVKLWVTTRCLNVRRRFADLFSIGEYIPLNVTGVEAEHVIAFARRLNGDWATVVVPRCLYGLTRKAAARKKGGGPPSANWEATRIVLPDDSPGQFCCELSGERFDVEVANGERGFSVKQLFKILPVAILKSV
jgi:(1->4)-alpha-D-glucan 1-alpha-D-glucosylmutase